jgi:hypothetical protein
MVELETIDCCNPETQQSCCAPEAKDECCGTAAGCGCGEGKST